MTSPDDPTHRVVELDATDTHDLRRAVLRRGDPAAAVVFDTDADASTVHLGIRDAEGTTIAISSWTARAYAADLSAHGVQLRGMAVAATMQGSGIGGLLFEAGVERMTDDGFEVLWARARDAALAFYVDHGCIVVGEGFVDTTTDVPHHIIVRELSTHRTAVEAD